MNFIVAQYVARRAHVGQLTRCGEELLDHVERVADAVPDDARAIAYLHDVLEHSDWSLVELRANGLADGELAVLQLLTRRYDESWEAHVRRIAGAGGPEGAMARTIKLADLDDHLSRPTVAASPDYAWARMHVEASCRWRGESHTAWAKAPARAAAT